jgi:hypothetical protein
MAKPFIAARVPQKIEDKLNERVQETGLGKTEIIVNALAEYLRCSIDVPEETRAIDRLVAAEKELAELKSRISALEKTTNPAVQKELLLDNNIAIKVDKDSKSQKDAVQETDNTTDKIFENKKISKEEIAQKNDNKFDNDQENVVYIPWIKAIELLSVSKATLYNRVKNDELPFTKNGHTLTEKIKGKDLWGIQKADNALD